MKGPTVWTGTKATSKNERRTRRARPLPPVPRPFFSGAPGPTAVSAACLYVLRGRTASRPLSAPIEMSGSLQP